MKKCHKCNNVFNKEYTLYCSTECEDLAVKDWSEHPFTKYNDLDFTKKDKNKYSRKYNFTSYTKIRD